MPNLHKCVMLWMDCPKISANKVKDSGVNLKNFLKLSLSSIISSFCRSWTTPREHLYKIHSFDQIVHFHLDCFLHLRNIMTKRATNKSHLGDTAIILTILISDWCMCVQLPAMTCNFIARMENCTLLQVVTKMYRSLKVPMKRNFLLACSKELSKWRTTFILLW